MILRLTARFTSLAGIAIILAGYLVSAARHEEVYLACAVSYWLRACAILDAVHGENWLTALLWMCLSFALVFGALGGALISSCMTLARGPGRVFLRAAFLSYYLLGILLAIGLFLVSANHGLTDVGDAEEISLSAYYYALPIAFVVIGVIYHLLWRTFVASENSERVNRMVSRRTSGIH